MFSFLRKNIAFAFIFSSPLIALEIYVQQPSVDEFSAKNKFLEENKNKCEVLLMGSSHTQTGLNPEWLDKPSVNVANFSQPFYYDYKILEKYADEMEELEAVVLSLSYPVFYSGPTERQENLYSIHWGLEPYSGKTNIDNYSAVLALGLENSINRIFLKDNYYKDYGWYQADETYSGAMIEAENKVDVWHGMMHEKDWEECTGWLDKISGLCKTNNLRLILYYPPFSKNLNSIIVNDHWENKIASYAKEMGRQPHVTLINANDNEIYTDDYFSDPDHVNKKGAEMLTNTINDALSTPVSHR